MKKWGLIFVCCNVCANAQNINLVPNYSFEKTNTCGSNTDYDNLENWYIPAMYVNNTPDLYSICNAFYSDTYRYKRHTGDNSVGFFTMRVNIKNGREFIAVKFVDTLKVNKSYCFSAFLIPALNGNRGTNNFAAYFGTGTQSYPNDTIPKVIPQIALDTNIIITDTFNWYNFQAIYNASGNETDIMLGSFLPDSLSQNPIFPYNPWWGAADFGYFMIDDVSLYEVSIDAGMDAVTCPQNMLATIGETNLDTAFKSYYWYDASGALIDSINSQITVQPTSSTFYIEEKRMCGQSLWDTVYVNIINECPPEPEVELVIPNVFSPNDDGINDTWQLQIDEQRTKDYNCIIYNRYGLKMFESNRPKEAWTGRTTSGTKCNEGVYYYVIEFTNSKDEKETQRGYISLFR